MTDTMASFKFGDRVRHPRRPEWGTGSVTAVETQQIDGRKAQRVSVRFSNGGLKTISTAHIDLERVEPGDKSAIDARDDETSMQDIEVLAQSGWLAGVAQQKLSERMVELPMAARDPFDSLSRRLANTLELYRFDRSGRGMIEWAIAQSGLDDPLNRFSRHDLEQFFDRWETARDDHLASLLRDVDPASLASLLDDAPPAARAAVRRFTGVR